MKKLIYALRFLTVIPIRWKENEDLAQVARSVSLFPLVGLLIGLSVFAVFKSSSLLFSDLFSSVVAVVWWIFITGGLHLDGLADTADGVWGGTTKERRLEIMKDSRTGVFGVVTLISFILMKTVAINELGTLDSIHQFSFLVTAPVYGRWISVLTIYFFQTAREDGLGSFFRENIGIREVIIAFSITLIVSVVFSGLTGLLILIAVTVLSSLGALFFSSRLGGLTGDIYGALCESVELITLLLGFLLFSTGVFTWLNSIL